METSSSDKALERRGVVIDKPKYLSVGIKNVAFEHKGIEKAHVHIDLDIMPGGMVSGKEMLVKASELVHKIGKIEL